LFTAVVRVTGAGRIQDFQERLRWLMVRDEDAEDYTEHHAGGTLEYRFRPKRGIPFPAFTTASADFPELRVEAEWQRDGERGRAGIETGKLVEQSSARVDAAQLEVWMGDAGRLELALACRAKGEELLGYAVTHDRHTYWRWQDGRLSILGAEDPDVELEEVAFAFVEEWIWYDEEDAALERARYANYGYPVRGANLKSEKIALLRAAEGTHSSLDSEAKAARDALKEQWLRR
jgi:hypothetical protein